MRFLLKPSQLSLGNKNLISETALNILNQNNIDLFLDVQDSNRSCDQPPIVFIHGNSSSKKAFKDQIEFYSKTCRVISLDLLGHGDSSKISDIWCLNDQEKDILAENFYNPCAMIAEIVQIFRRLNVLNAHFVGWSLGGHLAYGTAVEAPELVASITSIGSPPVEFTMEGFQKGFHELFTDKVIPEWISNTTRNLPHLDKSAEFSGYTEVNGKDKFFIDDLVGTDPRMRKFLFLNLDQYKNLALDGESFVKSTSLPLCLIIGDRDTGIRTEYYNEFVGNLRNELSQVHLIEGAKHAVFRTNKEEFMNTLSQFIDSMPECSRQKNLNLNVKPKSALQRLSLLANTRPDESNHDTQVLHDKMAPTRNSLSTKRYQ